MEAVVLAGGNVPPLLQPVVGNTERALIEVDGKSMLAHVLDSLLSVPIITRIICVTTPEAIKTLPEGVVGLPAGDKMTQNLFAGARAAQGDRVLIVTGDVPLATGRTWMQFIDGAAVNLYEAAYPIVSKESCEAQFPGGTRTYARLKDGTFTGGNAFLMPRARLEALESLIDDAFAMRKNPLKLARMLGPGFIVRFLSRRLTIMEVEAKISGLLGCRSGAVIVPDAAIAFDVDKASDLETACVVARQRKTEQNQSRP